MTRSWGVQEIVQHGHIVLIAVAAMWPIGAREGNAHSGLAME